MNDVSVESYLKKGYLKEALINFVALLGWHSADDQEIYTLEELCEAFSLERVNKAGAIFDLTKLDWMNGHYMRNLPLNVIAERAEPFFTGLDISDPGKYLRIISAARERCTLLPELAEYARMFYEPIHLNPSDLELLQAENARRVLNWWLSRIADIDCQDSEAVQGYTKMAIEELGIKGKNFYMPLRLALIGQPHGPDLPTIFAILGQAEISARLSI
jgi:glutamyl/glutaminyl-tRNA synthetase